MRVAGQEQKPRHYMIDTLPSPQVTRSHSWKSWRPKSLWRRDENYNNRNLKPLASTEHRKHRWASSHVDIDPPPRKLNWPVFKLSVSSVYLVSEEPTKAMHPSCFEYLISPLPVSRRLHPSAQVIYSCGLSPLAHRLLNPPIIILLNSLRVPAAVW